MTLKRICEILDTSVELVRSSSHKPAAVIPRRIISVFYKANGFSYKEIGEMLNRHYSSIHELIRTHQALMKSYPRYEHAYTQFIKDVENE